MEHRKRILVIDDDYAVVEAWALLLELEGFEPIRAANGQEALDILQSGPPPAVIILDLMMPIMNGFELANILAKSERLARIPIVVLSAYIEEAERVKGARARLAKPVEISLLLETIQNLSTEVAG